MKLIAKIIAILGILISFVSWIFIARFVDEITRGSLGGFGVFLFGMAITIVPFVVLWIIAEIAENTEKVRDYLKDNQTVRITSQPIPEPNNFSEPGGNDGWKCNSCGQRNAENVELCSKCGNPKSGTVSDNWICKYCGTKNNIRDRYCISCRQDKLSSPSGTNIPPSQQGDYWRCPQCGQMNSVFSYACSKCGNSKY